MCEWSTKTFVISSALATTFVSQEPSREKKTQC